MSAADWILLRAVGQGYEYSEIAVQSGVAPGALRAQVLRLRRRLANAADTTLKLAS